MSTNAITSSPGGIAPLPQLTAAQTNLLTSATSTPTSSTSTGSDTSLAKLPGYASPIYRIDPLADISIELIRDPSTGSVINQIPAEQVVEKYRLGLMQPPGVTNQQITAGQTTTGQAATTSGGSGQFANTGLSSAVYGLAAGRTGGTNRALALAYF